MNRSYILGIVAIVLMACAISGCSGTTNTTTGTPVPQATVTAQGSGASSIPMTVTDTGSSIVIKGGPGEKQSSDAFTLDGNAWYIVKVTYSGPKVSLFQAGMSTDADFQNSEYELANMANAMNPYEATIFKPKGAYDPGSYRIRLIKAEGPWSIEFQKSPQLSSSTDTDFKGPKGTSLTPAFHLKPGPATFVMKHDTSGAQLYVDMFNADTGEAVTKPGDTYLIMNGITNGLEWNSIDPSGNDVMAITDTVQVPVEGNYIMAVSSGSGWEILYSQ